MFKQITKDTTIHILISFVTLIFLVSYSTFFYKHLVDTENNVAKQELEEHLSNDFEKFKLILEERIFMLDALANHWVVFQGKTSKDWDVLVKTYFDHFNDLNAISILDINRVVKQVYPLNNYSKFLGQSLAYEKNRIDAFNFVESNKKQTFTGLVKLKSGNLGYLSIHPIVSNNIVVGFIVAGFEAGNVFNSMIDKHHYLLVKLNNDILFSNFDSSINDKNVISTSLEIGNQKFEFKSTATDEAIENLKLNFKAKFIYTILLFISVIIVFILFFLLRKQFQFKSGEKKLSISLKNIELALSSGDLGIWDWNLVTNEVYYDERWFRILGYEPKTFPNTLDTWDKLCHPEDKIEAKKRIEDYLNGKSSHYEIIFRMKHREGHWVNILSKGTFTDFDDNGKPLRFTGTHFDFSHQKFLETELRNKNQMLDSIFTNTPGVIYRCLLNENWTMIYINDEIENISGYSKSDFLNDSVRTYSSIIHIDDRKKIEEFVLNAVNSKIHYEIEYRIVHKDGSIRHVFERGSLCDTSSNDEEKFLDGFIIDISKQKLMEKALIENQKNFEEAQKVAKIGIWNFDILLNKIYWTDQMYYIFPEDKKNGEPDFNRLLSTIYPDDQKRWLEIVEKCIADGKEFRMRFRTKRNDQIIWVEAYGRGKKDLKGKVESLFGTCQDITDKVLKEEELQLERLKVTQSARLAALGQMAGGIAHEINNPITIIQGYSRNIIRVANNIDGELKEQVVEQATKIDKVVMRIAAIVKGLRNFARDGSKDEFKSILIKQVIEETLDFCITKFEAKGIKLNVNCPSDIYLECQAVQISQVLLNLLNNAYDAVKDIDGEKWVNVVVTLAQPNVEIRISNSGKKILEEVAVHIFEPFFTTKKVGEGTGLGLSISKGIIDEHRGTIECSLASEFTEFLIVLPIKLNPTSNFH